MKIFFLYEYNEDKCIVMFCECLKGGELVVLISDVGILLISDLGFVLVCKCCE